MKIFIVLALVAVAACDKFDKDVINKQQEELIKKTIAELQEWAKNKLTGPVKMGKCVNDKLEIMNKNMMEEADKREKEGLPLVKWCFQNVSENVYGNPGRHQALYYDIPKAIMHNKTDGALALAKFCATSVVIEWRTTLDKERRTVHPTDYPKDEATAWDQWKVETDKVVAVLKKLIPELHEMKSEFWAHQHEKMLEYIEKGIPMLNQKIRDEKDEKKRIQYLGIFAEDLRLLNTVASSR